MINLPKPVFDRLLVKPISSEQTFSGIIIPDTSSNLKKGVVVAVGEGRNNIPMSVKENQTVFFKRDAGIPLTLEGESYLLMEERDILLWT